MAPPRQRIALLIDADNAPASRIVDILGDLAQYGECNVRRAYGNWDQPNLKPWKDRLQDQAIRPVQQYDYSKHKNASDMAMVVDAMALLYAERPEAYAIVSSDADFTPLVMHLREKGIDVYGYGELKAPDAFQRACSRFTDIMQLGVEGADESVDVSAPETVAAASVRPRRSSNQLKSDTTLVQLLRKSIKTSASEDGWARLSTVGQRIRNQSSEDPRNYGYASWTKLLKAIDLFELRGENTPDVAVRDPRDLS